MENTPIILPYSLATTIMDNIFNIAYAGCKAADVDSSEPIEAYSAATSMSQQLFSEIVEKLTPDGFTFMWDASK